MPTEIKGLKGLLDKFKKMPDAMRAELKKATAENALMLESELKRVLTRGGRSGRKYKRGGKTHTASAAGEAPASDSGQLARHMKHKIAKGGLSATIGLHDVNDVEYAAGLEFGTSKIKPRPLFRPVYKRLLPAMRKRYEAAARRGLKVR